MINRRFVELIFNNKKHTYCERCAADMLVKIYYVDKLINK